jgi:uncharacterized membrane protein YbhN (UPF0104 family)
MSEEESKENNKGRSGVKRLLILLLKIGITILCFWYIAVKIDFTEAIRALFRANWFYLAIALFFFILSKFLSAIRLNINFRNIGLQLSSWKNIKLYWLGMFYNLFLPGAISGDAYKVILLNRRYKSSLKKTSAAVLIDRFSGVLALGVILSIYGFIVLDNQLHQFILLAGAVMGILVFFFIIKILFPDFLPGFLPTFFWGLCVQSCQVICIYFIMISLQIPWDQHEWIFIFLFSAVITVLPISLGGGLGTREVVFAEGAHYFHLDPQTGVVISLLFYLLTILGSIWGLYYNFHDPLKHSGERE